MYQKMRHFMVPHMYAGPGPHTEYVQEKFYGVSVTRTGIHTPCSTCYSIVHATVLVLVS